MSSSADRIIFSMNGAVHYNAKHNGDRATASMKSANHYSSLHIASMVGRKITYHYLTITNIRGSTTNRGSIPANAIVEAIIAT